MDIDGMTTHNDLVVASTYCATIPTYLALWHRHMIYPHLHVGLVLPAQSHDSGIDLVLSCVPF